MTKYVEEKVTRFFKNYRAIRYKKNHILIFPRETIPAIYFLKKGLVRQYVITEKGEEITLHIFKPLSYFPIMLSLAGVKNKYFFQALGTVEVRKAPCKDVLTFLKSDAEVLLDLTKRLSEALCGILIRIENSVGTDSSKKIASIVSYLKKSTNQTFTHQQIATWAGTARETVTRTIKKG